MIDEKEGIVVYNYQLKGARDRFYALEHEGGVVQTVDLAMKITLSSEKLIMANDDKSIFAITKHNGEFVYSFVVPLPDKNGDYFTMDVTHRGKCAKSPFQ